MLSSVFASCIYVTPQTLSGEWPAPGRDFLPEYGARAFETTMEQAEFAEDLGFDWVSFSEHHYSNETISPTPIVAAAFLAARLKRVKIAMLGPHMPLNNPVRVAEELAMLDNLAPGRLVVGLLRGTPNEYIAYRLNPAETRDRTSEGMELVLRAWQETEPFGWEGRYFSFPIVSIWPRPFQQPHPPTYVLGTSRESCEFAARHRLGIGVSFGPFEIVANATNYYRECCAREGWEPSPEQIIYRGRIFVGETDEQAHDDFKRYFSTGREFGPFPIRPSVGAAIAAVDPSPMRVRGHSAPPPEGGPPPPGRNAPPTLGPTFIGSPDTVAAQVKRCREVVGAGVIDLFFQGPSLEHSRVMRSMELYGKEVLPQIKDL